MVPTERLVPVSSWLTLPRWVYRHRIHSGYFEDMAHGAGHAAERERQIAERMTRSGLEWPERKRPDWIVLLERRWQETFGDSTPEDAFRATGHDPQEEDTDDLRRDALERMAGGLARAWSTGALVRQTIAEQAEVRDREWEAVKVDAAAAGLCLALGRSNTPQRIRFGNQYVVKPPDLTPVEVRPVTELSAVPFIRWLHRQAIAEAEALVLGGAPRDAPEAPAPETVPLDDCLLLEDVAGGELEEIILGLAEVDHYLAAAELTPALMEAVEALRLTGDWLEAGHLLGINPGTMRERKRLIREKLRQAGAPI